MPGEAKDSTIIFPGKEERPVRILLFRHGAAEGSEDGRFISRTEVGLLPEGKCQVRQAAVRARHWLDGMDGVFVFSSPLLRARESAKIICREMDLPPAEEDRALVELDLGRWEGESYESLMAKEPERLRLHYENFVRSRPPGGESLMDLARRVRPVFRRIRDVSRGGGAVVVAHAAVNRIFVLDSLGSPLRNFFRVELAYGSLCVVEFYGDAPLVRLING